MAKLWKNIAGAAVLVGATTLITSHVTSQDPYGDMPPEAQRAMERMEAWMKYGAPGPEHVKMANAVGTWHNENRYWMYPGADGLSSESVSRIHSIMGGRFLIEEMSGVMEFMGEKQVFEGFGIHGYDRYREKHFFIWLDSMSTMPMWGEGTADASGDIVYLSKMPDPSSGKSIEFKSVQKRISDDKIMFTMYEKQGDGSWFKHMEMTATR